MKIKKNLEEFHPLYVKTIDILRANKIIVVIVMSFIILIYFFGIRPSQIRKDCSTVIKDNSYQYTNPEYNEINEKLKQKELVAYIDCRNNNLTSGDEFFTKMNGYSPYPFTQDQYNTLPIKKLAWLAFQGSIGRKNISSDIPYGDGDALMLYNTFNLRVLNEYALGKLSSALFHTYNGYIIDNVAYGKLKEGSIKYPQCYFPQDLVKETIFISSKISKDASNAEYTSCLRKNGIADDKILTPQQILENKTSCYKWYGKEACDDPNFNPE